MPNRRPTFVFTCIVFAALLAGCTTTRIESNHPALAASGTDEAPARVYFIRPGTEHMQGFPDNPLKVIVDGELLMELGKEEYALVELAPGPHQVTLENLTQIRGRWEVMPMSRSRALTFEPGQVHYLVTRPFDGEFRGVHFTPELVSAPEARRIAERLRPVGAAEKNPIPNP